MSPIDSEPVVRSGDLRRIAQPRRSFWATLLIMAVLIGLLGAAAWLGWFDTLAASIPPSLQLAALVSLSLAPALVGLLIFAILSRKNNAVSRIAFLLWLVTAALYLVSVRPLAAHFFPLEPWMTARWWSHFLIGFFITATLEMFLVYLVLRLGVYPGSAMQSSTDGPLYGMASALGLAAIVTVLPLLEGDTGSMSDLALWTAKMSLSYAALGALLGYFLVQARFKRTHLFYLAAGFLLTVLLHAVYFTVLRAVDAQQSLFSGLGGLLWAAFFALAIFIFIFWRLKLGNKEFMRIAALVEIKEEEARPRSLLEGVIHLVETQQIEVRPSPPLPPVQPAGAERGDELTNLETSWAALIQEQEGSHDSI